MKQPTCLIGFDGFTDDLVQAVKVRSSASSFTPMQKMKEFGAVISESATLSCNIELVSLQRKVGGNGAILASALLEAEHPVIFIGAIGKDNHVEPLFQQMAHRCQKVISIAASGHTDAIEFEDGKIMLGKHESIVGINYDLLLQFVSKTELIQIFDTTDLFASCNWTMIPEMNQMWKKFQEEILPYLSKRKRIFFIDLADPRKRTDEDLKEALHLLTHWGPTHEVILGLNQAEAKRIEDVTGTSGPQNLCRKLQLHAILVHSKQEATVATREQCITKSVPFCEHPKISTGAGDHFNAGFCSGLLYKLSLEDCLELGIATAGFYIRHAKSPTHKELLEEK